MTLTLNLVHDPWIDCLTTADGAPCTVGLRELLQRARELTVAEADPLVEGAIWRLLVAIGYAAGAYPADSDAYDEQILRGADTERMRAYLDASAECFGVFDPERPFGQDRRLSSALGTPSVRPSVYLDVTAAVDRALLADTRHLVNPAPLTPIEALRALLVQNLWGFGGRSQGSSQDLGGGKLANYLIPTPLNGRILLCPAASTVMQGLAWRLIPTDTPGSPMWTFPDEEDAASAALDGEASAATWLSRRVLLVAHPGAQQVHGVLLARGLSYADVKDIKPGDPAPGWSDVATGPKTATAGQAVTSPDDMTQIVANFEYARPDSFITHAIAAAARTGRSIPCVAISLVAALRGQKKPEAVHRVPLPAAILTNRNAVPAAQAIVEMRRSGAPGKPAGLGVEEFEDWLREADPDPRPLLERIYEGVLAHTRGAVPLHGRDGVDRRMTIDATAGKIVKRLDAQVPQSDAADDPAPAPEQDLDSDLFGDDESLFVTADSRPSKTDTEDDPAAEVVRRLCGYVLQGKHRGTLADLRHYALRPELGNQAMSMATRGVPAEHTVAATTVAALFACWHEGRQLSSGDVPMARMARSFGNGRTRGTSNSTVKAMFDRVMKTQEPDKLLRALLPLLKTAGKDVRARPDWRGLYDDILGWADPALRTVIQERWALLFWRNTPVDKVDEMLEKGLAIR